MPDSRSINVKWYPPQIEEVMRLWREGVTYSDIARRLKKSGLRPTANRKSIAGLIMRNRGDEPSPITLLPPVTKKPKPEKPQATWMRTKRLMAIYVQPVKLRDMDREVEGAPADRHCGVEAVLDLTGEKCHWPLGDPRSPMFHFCCAPTHGNVYCACHERLAHGYH